MVFPLDLRFPAGSTQSPVYWLSWIWWGDGDQVSLGMVRSTHSRGTPHVTHEDKIRESRVRESANFRVFERLNWPTRKYSDPYMGSGNYTSLKSFTSVSRVTTLKYSLENRTLKKNISLYLLFTSKRVQAAFAVQAGEVYKALRSLRSNSRTLMLLTHTGVYPFQP